MFCLKNKVYKAVAKILGCLIHAIGKTRNLTAGKFSGFCFDSHAKPPTAA